MLPPYIVGIDGKSYPRQVLRSRDREWVIGRCHWLSHESGLSVRQIREHLLYNCNLLRSVGSIASYLAEPCVRCSGGASNPPEHSGRWSA